MDEIGFRNWLNKSGTTRKVKSDTVSRLKTLQRALGNIDIDIEYKNDGCKRLLDAFKNKGENATMESYGETGLPVGKYTLSAYSYALRKYIQFLKEQ